MNQAPKRLIAIATYNELENLPELLRQLNEFLPECDILIVDDHSPDGSPAWLEEQSKINKRLNCLIRKNERGLGSASRAALCWAVEKEYDWVATMDADLSHAPADLTRLLERSMSDPEVDVVIGSRYVSHGKIEGWSLIRKVSSRLINIHSRIFLGLKTRDNSGAFRVYRVQTLEKMDPSRIRSNGYVYLQEVLYRLKKLDARFVEVPITFRDREKGQSKINFKEACKAVLKIIQLPWQTDEAGKR